VRFVFSYLDLLRLACIKQSMPWPRGFHQQPLSSRSRATRGLGLVAMQLRVCTLKRTHTHAVLHTQIQTQTHTQQTFGEANNTQQMCLVSSPAEHVWWSDACVGVAASKI